MVTIEDPSPLKIWTTEAWCQPLLARETKSLTGGKKDTQPSEYAEKIKDFTLRL